MLIVNHWKDGRRDHGPGSPKVLVMGRVHQESGGVSAAFAIVLLPLHGNTVVSPLDYESGR